MTNALPRPAETATALVAKLCRRLRDRSVTGQSEAADNLEDIATGADLLATASLFDNGTRKRAQPINAICDARVAATAALGRMVEQMQVELDALERAEREDRRGDEHATGDVLEVR